MLDLQEENKKILLDYFSGKRILKPTEKDDWDDKDAGNSGHIQFWNIPTYTPGWQKSLEMKLTPAEAGFLKQQINNTYGGKFNEQRYRKVVQC